MNQGALSAPFFYIRRFENSIFMSKGIDKFSTTKYNVVVFKRKDGKS